MSIVLIGLRSRMVVTPNWLCDYLTFERGTRLIASHVDSRARPRGRPPDVPEENGESLKGR